MNKKLLCAALLGSLGLAQAASAQEFDDRWYVSGTTGVNFQDKDRATEDSLFVTMGFGKFLNPNFSLEAELNYQNPDKTSNPNLWWSQYGVSVDELAKRNQIKDNKLKVGQKLRVPRGQRSR